MLKTKKPKFIQIISAESEAATIDVEKAVELGPKNGVDCVVVGTIPETESNSSTSGVGGINLLGQSAGSSLRTVSAPIAIQGDLINVKDGKLVESFRANGSQTDASVDADASTEWGSINSDKDGGGNSPTA